MIKMYIICPDIKNIDSMGISDDGYGNKISIVNVYF